MDGSRAGRAAVGYVANEAQSGASQTGIALLQTAVPGVFAALAVGVTAFYSLTGAQLEQLQRELETRHADSQRTR